MTEARAHVFVSGDVQEVHFRDNVHETARAHDIEGGYGTSTTDGSKPSSREARRTSRR